MNDWSRLAVDLNEKQKLGGRKQELHQYKYAPDKRRTGPRPVRKRELTNPTVGRRGEDNSVCPLTNTYHEWPVINAKPLMCRNRKLGQTPVAAARSPLLGRRQTGQPQRRR